MYGSSFDYTKDNPYEIKEQNFVPGPNDHELFKVDIYYDEIPEDMMTKMNKP